MTRVRLRPASNRPHPFGVRFNAPQLRFSDADDGPRWVEITASGVHSSRQGDREVELTAADVESIHRGFQLVKAEGWFSRGAPVGTNHATMSGALDAESTKALGYIVDTRIDLAEDGRTVLLGLIDYTAEGRRRVRAGEFQGFSIEAIPADAAKSKRTGEPLGEWALIGGTLTNHPFVPGMATLAASETAHATPENRNMKPIASRLGLSEDAADAVVLAEFDRVLTERDDKIAALADNLSTVTADRDALTSKVEALSERDKARTLDDACAVGRCSAGERERYWKALTALGEEHANEVYPEQRIATKSISTPPGSPDQGGSKTSVVAKVNARAKVLAEDGRHSAQAFADAYREIVTTPEAAAAFNSAEA